MFKYQVGVTDFKLQTAMSYPSLYPLFHAVKNMFGTYAIFFADSQSLSHQERERFLQICCDIKYNLTCLLRSFVDKGIKKRSF